MIKTTKDRLTPMLLSHFTWTFFILFCFAFNLKAQIREVSGIVVSALDQEPMIGVAVMVKGTTTGVITDIGGNYSIKVEPGQNLVFSYIGYVTQTIRITNQTKLDVALVEDTQTLEEVVVVGY